MATASPIVQDISDTARWAAAFRARESQRPDALFRDPFAQRLAGVRGFGIADTLSGEAHSTSWVVRTYLFDQMVAREILDGAEIVVNLGAGLDVRPYRMNLPPSLRWIEVDVPEILAYKKNILAGEKPRCVLERIGLDLLDREARLTLFSEIGRSGKKTLIMSEGVLIYFRPEDAAALALELAAQRHFQRWILEIVSPAVLETMNRTAGRHLDNAGVSFRFGPKEGPGFFEPYGWRLADGQSVLKTAIRLNRTPINPALQKLIPDVPPQGENCLPWVGVCLFHSQEPTPLSPI